MTPCSHAWGSEASRGFQKEGEAVGGVAPSQIALLQDRAIQLSPETWGGAGNRRVAETPARQGCFWGEVRR